MSLVAAASDGQTRLVRVLLQAGADARGREDDGSRALDCAAYEGHREVVELLLRHDRSLLDLPGLSGRTALLAAASADHLPLVQLLLARGANPHLRDMDGFHALDWAAASGYTAVVEVLLDHDPRILELPGYGERTALIAAAARGHSGLVDRLLAYGADPRRRCVDGARALDCAARHGHVGVIERLLAHDDSLLDLPGAQAGTALMAAATQGHLEAARLLLSRGADPRRRDADDLRALDAACQRGHLRMVEMLLDHDRSLLEQPGSGAHTALIIAAGQGHVPVVSLLLSRGADPRPRQSGGVHALEFAAQEGHLAVVQLLLSADASLVNLPGNRGRTALIAAADSGHSEIVALLLEQGADPRRRRNDGAHALDCAARKGHQRVVEEILACDPSLLDLPGRNQRTALISAVGGRHGKLVALLLARGANPQHRKADGTRALDLAAQQGDQGMLEQLLTRDRGLLDLPGHEGRTALMAAAASNHVAQVRWLLSKGADPSRQSFDGARALDWSAEKGHVEVVACLLQADRSLLNLPGYGQRTALLAALTHQHPKLARWLLAQGADPQLCDATGCRPLDWAAEAGDQAMVEALLLQGADPRGRRKDGAHALDLAARQGHQAVVDMLLACDPQLLELPGSAGRTALSVAASRGHLALVKDLLQRGADPHQRRADGGNCLYWAARQGHRSVVELLVAHDPGLLDHPVIAGSAAEVRLEDLERALRMDYRQAELRMPEGANLIEVLILARKPGLVQALLQRHPRLVHVAGMAGATPLMLSAGTMQEGLLRDLLALGADPAARDRAGHDALFYALNRQAHQCCSILAAHDSHLRTQDR